MAPGTARTAAPPQPSVGRALLPLLMFLPILLFLIPGLRIAMGEGAGVVLAPLIGFDGRYPLVTVLLAGTVPSLASTLVRHLMTDWVEMARRAHVQRAFQRELLEARLKKNVAKLKKLQEQQLAIIGDPSEQFVQQYRSTLPTTFFFIMVFAWMSIFLYEPNVATDVVVPWSNTASLLALYGFPAWVWLYTFLSVPLTMVLGRVLRLFSFRRRLEELGPS